MAKPLSRLRVDADWLYACTSRCGSGTRASRVNSAPLMMSPLHPHMHQHPTWRLLRTPGIRKWPRPKASQCKMLPMAGIAGLHTLITTCMP